MSLLKMTEKLILKYLVLFCVSNDCMLSRVIHEKSDFKFLTSSSLILFIIVIRYIMQNLTNFEKSLEGATSVLNFVHKVNGIREIKMFPAILSHL